MRIRIFPIWVSNNLIRFYRIISPLIDKERFQTKPAVLTVAAAILILMVVLFVRTFRLSLAIRKSKENSRYKSEYKKEIHSLRLKSCLGSLLILIGLAAVVFILVYLVYPRIFGQGSTPAGNIYDRQESIMLAERFLLFGSRFAALSFIVLWLWAFSRRIVSSGGRKFFTFVFLCCLVGFNMTTAKNLTSGQREMASVRISGDEMLEEAFQLYNRGEYAKAEGIYAELAVRGGYTKSTDADVLNNLALSQLQQEKNEEGLATMRRVFETENANAYHVINLLVAAHVNGISSRAILDENHTRRYVSHIRVPKDDAGEYVKLRNSIAYNLSYMDMELDDAQSDQGTGFGSLFPNSEIPYSMGSGWASRDECLTSLDKALEVMQSDNQEAYGEEDPDITELTAYLDALQEGGVPTVEEEAPADTSGEPEVPAMPAASDDGQDT